jgi:hypothetical protein
MVLVVITCHRTGGKVSADMATDRQAWNPIATAWTDAAKKNSRVEAARRRRPQHTISYQHRLTMVRIGELPTSARLRPENLVIGEDRNHELLQMLSSRRR